MKTTLRNDTTGAITEHSHLQSAKQAARRIAMEHENGPDYAYWTITEPNGTQWRGTRSQKKGGKPASDGGPRLEWVERKMVKR